MEKLIQVGRSTGNNFLFKGGLSVVNIIYESTGSHSCRDIMMTILSKSSQSLILGIL